MKKKYVVIIDLALAMVTLVARWMIGWMLVTMPDCPVTRYGLRCPACGGTRCVRSFLEFRWGQAFFLNPFFFVLIWYVGVALLLLNVGVLWNVRWAQRLSAGMLHWKTVIVIAMLFGIFGIVRNFW